MYAKVVVSIDDVCSSTRRVPSRVAVNVYISITDFMSKFVCRVMAAGSIKMKQNGRIWWHLSSLRALRSKLQVVVRGPSRQWPSSRVTTRHKLDTIFRCLWNMDLTAASCPVANCFNPLRFINRECRRGSQITFFCPASLAQFGAI